MLPKIEIYEAIEIRYGYSIQDDLYHAHFDLPADRHVQKSLQSESHSTMPVASSMPGKFHIHGPVEGELLDRARTQIDTFLGK
ncbi:hypothetical protein HDE80_004247 [Rhodanobacter sp. A1T4]|nr:hypothetical protein [Rhodanobacter sp. A1T4]